MKLSPFRGVKVAWMVAGLSERNGLGDMKRAAMGGRYSLDSSGGESKREYSSYSNIRGDDVGDIAKGCRRGSMKVSLILSNSATYLCAREVSHLVSRDAKVKSPFFAS